MDIKIEPEGMDLTTAESKAIYEQIEMYNLL
jgi:hypothetical protein